MCERLFSLQPKGNGTHNYFLLLICFNLFFNLTSTLAMIMISCLHKVYDFRFTDVVFHFFYEC